ncbi:unnamed protein product [Tetraodon nigroviridis]|uniref:(spotted green pufferfish) hypothetical protein n=1 Tax=Tetraodon nigroviridis TaxID=99883 RepID=Q4S5I7_TETNG|nr:unnamed protein product [Tetraodon nigroviridis]
MTHQGRARSGAAPSVCEGRKERDICACDGGLVPEPLPPVQAVAGRTQTRSRHLPSAATTTPPVCLAVTQSAMCALKMLHNALLSLHSGSKRTIQ